MNNFTASMHTHVRSQYDADIDAQALCDRIKELGGKGCAITDHGVLSSIEDYRTVFADNDLKFIPGCELYVDGGILGRLHLVVLAKNDKGYKGICKIVTQANKTMQGDYPVISKEDLFSIMKEYKGTIFALSACMAGVISSIFLQNNVINKKIEKEKTKQNKYFAPLSKEDMDSTNEQEAAFAAVQELIQKRDETKALAEAKFVQREKAVAKLEASGDENAKSARAELEADKARSEQAIKELPEVKSALDKANKRFSNAKARCKEVSESIEKYLIHEEAIKDLMKNLKSDDELMQLALDTAEEYLNVFGRQHFLAEIQYHGIPEEAICFPKVVEVAQKVGLPLVATNDVHILTNSEDERLKRQILRSLRFGDNFEEEQVGDSELYLKDNNELKEALCKIFPEDVAERAIDNIDVIFNACNVEFKTGKHYPKYRE